ncbi:2Fe-2S iron-sulfur cluster-binding protein [Hydrogenophaga sp. 5NK40-0174]|uniref:2Fe-2S iron-sulfur cluster-binding protein n=1 Tax=Hydrogenophaga sp. 5NK40-0174 TaxID=3127649 RepID=UPI003105C9BD
MNAPSDAPSAEATLTFDGECIPFAPGETIMTAAMRAGHTVPRLCWHEGIRPVAACRLCTVHVNGRPVAACSTPAEAGTQVECHTPALQAQRLRLLQMLFVEGNHFCPGCEKSGHCQLQHQAAEAGMLDLHYEALTPQRPVDASHPDVLLDTNRCILCQLCVHASGDIDGKHVFAIGGHGSETRLMINSPTGKLGDSHLDIQDKAAQVCPVGALLPKRRGFSVPIGERSFDSEDTPS